MDKRHGGPYDRGSADRYYGRPFNPHYYRSEPYETKPIPMEKMTPEQIAEYNAGWDEENDQKNWL